MATREQRDVKAPSTASDRRQQDKLARTDLGRPGWRRDPLATTWDSPFDAMRRIADQFDRWPFAVSWARPGSAMSDIRSAASGWSPQIESFQRGDEFVVRADLPGLERKDVSVEVQDDALVIQGERCNEQEEQSEGYYTTERQVLSRRAAA